MSELSGKNDLLNERLKAVQKKKEEAKNNTSGVISAIVTGAEEKPDFMKLAAVLEEEKEEKKSANEGYIKDTIYIREDLYKAMQALCVQQGDKKMLVNAAYEEFLTREYKKRM